MTGLQDVTELLLASDPQHISADVYVYTYCSLVCYLSLQSELVLKIKLKMLSFNFSMIHQLRSANIQQMKVAPLAYNDGLLVLLCIDYSL